MMFDTVLELNDHFISKHRKLQCPDCDKSFNKPRSYHKHMYMHKTAKHACETCGKGFAFCSQLLAHIPVHPSTYMHHCTSPKCDKRFTHAGDLKKHLKSHSKKWWRCEVARCSYKNCDERNLKSHMISHSTKKGFACRYCDKKFQWSMQLVRHYESKECTHGKRSKSPSF